VQRIPPPVNIGFLDPETLLFLSNRSLIILNEAEWIMFLTHYSSENLVMLGIEPGISESVARNSDH
jgi:hypothetical protein